MPESGYVDYDWIRGYIMARRVMLNRLVQAKIELGENKVIRSLWDKEQKKWFFSAVDFIGVITESKDPFDTMKKIRKRERELGHFWKEITTVLPYKTNGGVQDLIFADTKGIFRLLQAIPSRNAEIIKRWIARFASVAMTGLTGEGQGVDVSSVYTDPQFAELTQKVTEIKKNLEAQVKKQMQ